MQFFDQTAVARALPYPLLVDALAAGLKDPIETPARSHFEPNGDDSTVLIMPAWKPHRLMGVKLVSVWPGNNALGLSAVSGVYVLLSCSDGRPVAVLDGTELTLRRTAACAALAARLLARSDSRQLTILGTGALSLPLAQAHASVLPLEQITVWGRSAHKAQAAAQAMGALGLKAQACADLQQALAQADIVAAATTATQAFIPSDWVRPGTHLGLMGAFTPKMAEAEPALMARARVFADQRAAVLEKGGEVLQALQQGWMSTQDLRADLAGLVRSGAHRWRETEGEVTVFKSVGFASLDWIAAEQVLRAHTD